MSFSSLLQAGRLQRHVSSRQEQDELRSVVERDLADAGLAGLSDDRSFATAYNAALQLGKMAIAAAGYRVAGQGHHHTTFQAVELAVGVAAAPYATYFDACRRKRNQLDYDVAQVASHAEARELIQKTSEFQRLVDDWMATNHPTLAPPAAP
jgi:hypothetical protein